MLIFIICGGAIELNTFLKKYKNKPEIDHVKDYLQEYYLDRPIRFNYQQALNKANIWVASLNSKNKNLKESGRVKTILKLENGFEFVNLLNQTAKDWEGLHMGHCVASYRHSNNIY